MSDRRVENARTLASLLGATEVEAAALLDATIDIVFNEDDQQATRFVAFLALILERTFSTIRVNPTEHNGSIELVVGDAQSGTSVQRIVVSQTDTRIGTTVSRQRFDEAVHPILLLTAACYAAARIINALFGDRVRVSAYPLDHTLVIPHETLVGKTFDFLYQPLLLSDTYMAGAGAIGNAIALALTLFDVKGALDIVDPDIVTDGNLNRCVLFKEKDKGKHKAAQLAGVLQQRLPNLTVRHHESTIAELGKTISSDTWLNRLLVGVDSPRARRHLQDEIPREVFDASTTGVEEVVFHHHIQPTDAACLACVYYESPNELARESHIAEALGVQLNDVKGQFVTKDAADAIIRKYPHLSIDAVLGEAFDTLFKALCSEGQIQVAEGRQVLAPFAFVSVLGGAIVVIEMMRRLTTTSPSHSFNYWRVSPWMPPVEALKRTLPRHARCTFCTEPVMLRVARRLWSNE